jgi:hypothetical protein
MGSLNHALPFIAVAHAVICTAWTASTASLGQLLKDAEAAAAESKVADEDGEDERQGETPLETAGPRADASPPTANVHDVEVTDMTPSQQPLLPLH